MDSQLLQCGPCLTQGYSTANLFLTEDWVDYYCSRNAIMLKKSAEISTGRIWFAEIQKFSIKIWYLFGELGREQLSELIEIAKQKRVDVIESSFNMARWQLETVKNIADILWEYGTYEIDLSLDEDTLWQKLHRKHKKHIKQAHPLVSIEEGISPDDFERIMGETYNSQKQNDYDKNYFIDINRYLGKNLLTGSARVENSVQSFVVIYYDKNRAYEIVRGTVKNPQNGVTTLLVWEMIKKLKAIGVKKFDFGGARKETSNPRLEGIFRFKRHFGGDFAPCCYWITKINPVKGAVYIILRKLRSLFLYKKYCVFK